MPATLIAELTAEHERIDAMLGSLLRYVQRRIDDGDDAADARSFLSFFRDYAGHFHHAREEEALFVALVQHLGVPTDRGPLSHFSLEHEEIAGMLAALAPLLSAETLDVAQGDALQTAATRYAHALWHHIDAENSVLLPEAADRLRRAHVRKLAARGRGPHEQALEQLASELIARHPPLDDRSIYRGDGCVSCPAYGVRCNGVEREWWSDEEWEDLHERAKHMD